ncbi:LysO family transporter [Selenihalanaerobacter shriftii]|uniref:DUF340 domain-containing protein n=1 Tax=Selenihalanaerobacter shriftii TaxID=142842 RepID=A0A1T4JZ21_9FIRM|nr:LysO family transporter [Selenihalanaerobacter shriftii]SJZ35378.1 Membrane protein of unknown function [Selenihalanaerobacter shriftii]
MSVIIWFLLLGLTIGYLEIIPERFSSLTDNLITGGLILLLFSMGVEIGLNDKVIANLDKLGFQAIVLALGSILGSLGLIKLLEMLVGNFRKEQERRG